MAALPVPPRRMCASDRTCYGAFLWYVVDTAAIALNLRVPRTLQRAACFYHDFLFDRSAALCPCPLGVAPPPTTEEAVQRVRATLCDLDACFRRYEAMHQGKRMSYGTLRCHTRYVEAFYHSVLAAEKRAAAVWGQHRGRQRHLGGRLGAMLLPRCRHAPGRATDVCLFPNEIRAVFAHAGRDGCPPIQRLLLVLFLSTGLRVGGMQKLRLMESVPDVAACHTLCTIEKGGVARTVFLSAACKAALAAWWRGGRGPADNLYVFPGSTAEGHIGTSRIGAHCKALLLGGGVPAHKAFSHCFRHTVVILLHMLGVSYETVSRWIGHRSAVLTSSVYGKLPMQTLRTLSQRVPFIGGGSQTMDCLTRDWEDVAQLISHPPWA